MIGWLVTYFRDTGRLGASLSLTTSTALWVFILIGRIFCAFLSTRMNKKILLVILGSLQLLFFLLMIGTRSIVLTYISLFGFGLAMSGTYPTTLSTMDPRYNASTIVTGMTIATASVGDHDAYNRGFGRRESGNRFGACHDLHNDRYDACADGGEAPQGTTGYRRVRITGAWSLPITSVAIVESTTRSFKRSLTSQ